MRIGSRFNVKCAVIITTDGNELTLSDTARYLGVYSVFAQMFCCSFKEAKQRFIVRLMLYLVKKNCRIAYENIIIQLLNSKCIPDLYYGLEASPVNKSLVKSLQFAINSCFTEIFQIKNSS